MGNAFGHFIYDFLFDVYAVAASCGGLHIRFFQLIQLGALSGGTAMGIGSGLPQYYGQQAGLGTVVGPAALGR